ncbi:MAG TPA: patatin-like phospholipase family protein [Solirubrobacteraceae bacterium]|nr:patatin-like phospholipase family protein [Solirubrobacteraceae bacterium]
MSGPRTAFVLGGGASLGAMQAGMLRALYERGIFPDFLVATSAGALNAAFVASRPQTADTADQLAEVWHELRREQIFPLSLRALLVGLAGRRDHLVPDRGLRHLLASHVEFTDVADAAIPLHVVAFDLSARSEVLFSQGPALEILTAAASIPGVFPPVRIGERSLVDGGVANNTPISHAVELGAERVFVMSTRESQQAPARMPRGALATAMDGLCQLGDARLQLDLDRHSNDVELIVLPAPNVLGVEPTNFSHSKRLIKESLSATRAFLDHGDGNRAARRELRVVPPSLETADELPSVA